MLPVTRKPTPGLASCDEDVILVSLSTWPTTSFAQAKLQLPSQGQYKAAWTWQPREHGQKDKEAPEGHFVTKSAL